MAIDADPGGGLDPGRGPQAVSGALSGPLGQADKGPSQ